jgi:hypothetical protein
MPLRLHLSHTTGFANYAVLFTVPVLLVCLSFVPLCFGAVLVWLDCDFLSE